MRLFVYTTYVWTPPTDWKYLNLCINKNILEKKLEVRYAEVSNNCFTLKWSFWKVLNECAIGRSIFYATYMQYIAPAVHRQKSVPVTCFWRNVLDFIRKITAIPIATWNASTFAWLLVLKNWKVLGNTFILFI